MRTVTFCLALIVVLGGCGSDDSSVAAGPSAACELNDNIERTKPDSIYTDNGDGTVTDQETALTWARCSMGQGNNATCSGSKASIYTSWHEAMEAAQNANAATYLGYSDWRVPSITELASLVDVACSDVAINTDVFPNIPAAFYWSSTPASEGRVWRLRFVETPQGSLAGGVAASSKANNSGGLPLPVRLVRGGP